MWLFLYNVHKSSSNKVEPGYENILTVRPQQHVRDQSLLYGKKFTGMWAMPIGKLSRIKEICP